jgi:hypothetical protein
MEGWKNVLKAIEEAIDFAKQRMDNYLEEEEKRKAFPLVKVDVSKDFKRDAFYKELERMSDKI